MSRLTLQATANKDNSNARTVSALPDMQRDKTSLKLYFAQDFEFMAVSSSAQGFSHYLAGKVRGK